MKKVLILGLLVTMSFGQLSFVEPPGGERQGVLIYWDSSYSMKNRDRELEFELLDRFFGSQELTEVEFVPFDHELGSSESFEVKGGDWSSLKVRIEALGHEGVSIYEPLDLDDERLVLVFSDGVPVLDELDLPAGNSVFLISSVPNVREAGALGQHMNYLNLYLQGVAGALGRLGIGSVTGEGTLEDERVASLEDRDREETDWLVEGIVYDRGVPLEGATIAVRGEERGTVTGSDGRFEIQAGEGQVLLIGYLGMDSHEYEVRGDDFLEIRLDSKNNELEEIVLQARRRDQERITTAYGEQKEEQIGYTVQTVEDEVFEGQSSISDATRGKILSYNYSQNDDLSQIQLRQGQTFASGTTNPLIVVDEIPLGVNQSSTGALTLSTWHIDPNNVEKITVLRGLAATNKYGTLARGGAILITTKTGVTGGSKKGKETNSAMLKGNDFNEQLSSIDGNPSGDYLKDLKKTRSSSEAYSFYLARREERGGDFEFFQEVSEQLVALGDPELSRKVLYSTLEFDPGRIENLRLGAMLLQDRKDARMTERVFRRILALRPEEAQSYRDLALACAGNDKLSEALDLYRNIKDDKYAEVDFSGLKKVLNSEMKGLLLKHGKQLNTNGMGSHYFTPLNYDVRVVLDWNDRDAEFVLQFVNPQKKYFLWSHNALENADRLKQERRQGINTEEFLLIDAEPGKWQVNIEAGDQKAKKPLALRYTIFRNYGTAEETRESRTLFLNSLEGKFLMGIIRI